MIQIDSPRGTFKLTDEWAAQFAGVPVGTPEPTVVARLNARLKVARATQDPKSEEAINASIQRTLFPDSSRRPIPEPELGSAEGSSPRR